MDIISVHNMISVAGHYLLLLGMTVTLNGLVEISIVISFMFMTDCYYGPIPVVRSALNYY